MCCLCTFVFVAIATSESATTFGAAEVLWVHVLAPKNNEFANNWLLALGTDLGFCFRLLDVLHVAIDAQNIAISVLLNFILLTSQAFTAPHAHKVFRMKIEFWCVRQKKGLLFSQRNQEGQQNTLTFCLYILCFHCFATCSTAVSK